MRYALWTMLLLGIAALPAAAQQEPLLTEEAARALAEFYNEPATTRISGETLIASGTRLDGPVAALGGPVVVAGIVIGDVAVLNGDLRLLPGGRIAGDVVITGGAFQGDRTAVTGSLTVYREAVRVRTQGNRIVVLGPARPPLLSAGRATFFGRTDFMVAVDGSYNRVEGLPVTFGPRLEFGSSNPTVVDARLVYRTRSGLRIHREEFGHIVRLEQFMGGHRALLFGISAYRSIDPIERRLTDTENSLSTFVLHRDYRDHYERHGVSAYLRFIGRTSPYEAGLEYRDENHSSVSSAEPWSLLDNDEAWRLQPAIGGGELRSVRGWFRWDSRNERLAPSAGWLLEIETEQGLEGDLSLDSPGGGPALEPEFTRVRVDARRYLRFGPRTRLALRAMASGSPDDGPLPPQRQHVLGGEGSLPAYDRFAFDCGARSNPGLAALAERYPYYGCDRQVLLQAEIHLAFWTGESLGQRLGLDFDLLTTPELVLFADGGRAWIEPESLLYRTDSGPRDLRYDAGLGLRLGRIGFYLAAPLNKEGEGAVNFFIRLGPRI